MAINKRARTELVCLRGYDRTATSEAPPHRTKTFLLNFTRLYIPHRPSSHRRHYHHLVPLSRVELDSHLHSAPRANHLGMYIPRAAALQCKRKSQQCSTPHTRAILPNQEAYTNSSWVKLLKSTRSI